MFVCIYMYTYTCRHVYIYRYIYLYLYMYTYICIYVWMSKHTCMYVYIYIYIYTCIHTYARIHIHIHVYVYRYNDVMYTYRYICIHMHMNKYIWRRAAFITASGTRTSKAAPFIASCALMAARFDWNFTKRVRFTTLASWKPVVHRQRLCSSRSCTFSGKPTIHSVVTAAMARHCEASGGATGRARANPKIRAQLR